MNELWLGVSIVVATGGLGGASFIFGYNKGFRNGAQRVLEEWKQTMGEGDNNE